MKYTAGWTANNGSIYNYSYSGNNKKELAKLMRDICKGNVFKGNTGKWFVRESRYNPWDCALDVLSGTVKNIK